MIIKGSIIMLCLLVYSIKFNIWKYTGLWKWLLFKGAVHMFPCGFLQLVSKKEDLRAGWWLERQTHGRCSWTQTTGKLSLNYSKLHLHSHISSCTINGFQIYFLISAEMFLSCQGVSSPGSLENIWNKWDVHAQLGLYTCFIFIIYLLLKINLL